MRRSEVLALVWFVKLLTLVWNSSRIALISKNLAKFSSLGTSGQHAGNHWNDCTFLVFKFISTHKFAYWIGNKLKGPFSRVRGELIIWHIQIPYSNSCFTTCSYSDGPEPMGVGWIFPEEGPRVDVFQRLPKDI